MLETKEYIILALVLLAALLGYRINENRIYNSLAVNDEHVVKIASGFKEVEIAAGFDPEDYVEYGIPTVVELCTTQCPACRMIRDSYQKFLAVRPDVAIRRIVIPNGWSPRMMLGKYSVKMRGTPHIMVFDIKGQLIAQDSGTKRAGSDFLYKWMNMELEKDWKRRYKEWEVTAKN